MNQALQLLKLRYFLGRFVIDPSFVIFPIILLFLLGGVSITDSAMIIGIVCIQILAGSIIWKHFMVRQTIDLIELMGMGGAIGFALSLISSQIFRNFIPTSIGWLILPSLSVFGCFVGAVHKDHQAVKRLPTKSALLFIFAGLLLALSELWFWLIPIPLSVMLLSFYIFGIFDLKVLKPFEKIMFNVLGVIGVGGVFLQGSRLFHMDSLRNDLWWNLNGVRQWPDSIFNESLMNSVQRFGNSDNIFMSGSKLNYHWLSFAWQATLGSIKEIEPFAISGIASNVIIIFITLCLLWSITEKLTLSLWGPPATILLVCTIGSSQILFVSPLNMSSSYSFSLIFLFALVNLLLISSESSVSFKSMLILMFSLVAVGAKVSTLPILLAGFFSLGIISIFRRQIVSRLVLIYGVFGMLGSILAFSYLYAFEDSGPMNKFSLKLGALIQQEGPLSRDTAVIFQIVISFAVISVFGQPLLGLFAGFRFLRRGYIESAIFVLGGGLFSILLGFSLFHDLEGTQYLVQSGLAVLIPFSVAAIISKIENSENWNAVFVSLMLGASYLISKGTWALYADLSESTNQSVWQTIVLLSQIIIAISIAGITVLIQWVSKDRFLHASFSSVLISVLLSCSASAYLLNMSDYSKQGLDVREWKWPESDVLSGSPEYRELLLWLKQNSMRSDLVASNRICQVASDLPPNCLALWSLTSAITNRQMLFEGVYPAGAPEVERAARMDLVDSFVDGASDQGRFALLNYGVRWVVADYAVTNARSWGEFAEVRFENKAGAILELVP